MGLLEDVSQSLETAIAQKVSGKDVAVTFSGGLDSGVVAAIAKKYAKSVKLIRSVPMILTIPSKLTRVPKSWDSISFTST